MSIQVLIVDQHAVLRQDLAQFLRLLDPRYEIVGEVGTADEALDCVATICPDLVLTAVELPDRSGLAVVQEIQQLRPMMEVIVMGDNITTEYGQAALAAGAASYVDQLDLVRTLPLALQAAMLRIANHGKRKLNCAKALPDTGIRAMPTHGHTRG